MPKDEVAQAEAQALLQLCRQRINTAPTTVAFHRVQACGVGVVVSDEPTLLQALNRANVPKANRRPDNIAVCCARLRETCRETPLSTLQGGPTDTTGAAAAHAPGNTTATPLPNAKRARGVQSPAAGAAGTRASASGGTTVAQSQWQDSEPSEHADAALIVAFEARPFDNMRTYEGLDRDLDYGRCARHHRGLCQAVLAAAKRVVTDGHLHNASTLASAQPAKNRAADAECDKRVAHMWAEWVQLAMHTLKTAPDGADTLGTDTLQKWRHWACASQGRSEQEASTLGDARIIVQKIDSLLRGRRLRGSHAGRRRKHKRSGNEDKRGGKRR